MTDSTQALASRRGGVLVVDDEHAVLTLHATIAERLGYSPVLKATDGAVAAEILNADTGAIEIVLLDLRMPRMDGITLMRHLVNVHTHPISVVVITGMGDPSLAERFRDNASPFVEPAEFMLKPISPEELAHAMARASALVTRKRAALWDARATLLRLDLQKVANDISQLSDETANRFRNLDFQLARLHDRLPGLAGQIGTQVIVALLLALFVLASLTLGLDGWLRRLLGR